jgi:hypothetical protein
MIHEQYPGKPEAGFIQWQETQEATASEEQLELPLSPPQTFCYCPRCNPR